MIVRKLKLKLNATQERELDRWLLSLASVYNFAIRKIEQDAKDRIYHTPFGFQNLLNGHSRRLDIPSHTLQGTLMQAYNAWQRCFKKLAKKPRLKGRRNRLNSVIFPDPIKQNYQNMVDNGYRIGLPGIGRVKFFKQELPDGKIKMSRIIKKPSGWYLALWLDAEHKFPVKDTDNAVGIDPGFSTLITLSDGTKYENPRELRIGEKRLAQAQRGKRKGLSVRLLERQANRRNDRNHKISRELVGNYKTIYYSNDNFKGLARTHGKSVSEASLGNLIAMITYKGRLGGRDVVAVNSKYTTMTCSACGAKSGPHGWRGLAVRNWECGCGAVHDRDINAAVVVLNSGAGAALKEAVNGLN